MPRVKVIVNPKAGRGHTVRATPRVCQCLGELGVDYDLVHTTAAGDAVHLARQALEDGFETIAAVGGDGTAQEVVNGLMTGARENPVGNLACIPTGSGNDFAVMNGVPEDIEGACQLIAGGATRVVDAGQVTIDGGITRYFHNVVGIGFDGLAAKETRKLKHLRGMALYLPVVLKTIFLTLQATQMEVTVDGEESRMAPLMFVVANGRREGGGFLVAPHARSDDGLFDLVIAESMPKLSMLALVPRFLKGTHLSDSRVTTRTARHITITSQAPLHFHVDGEILCEEAHHLDIRMIPGCLRVICPNAGSEPANVGT